MIFVFFVLIVMSLDIVSAYYDSVIIYKRTALLSAFFATIALAFSTFYIYEFSSTSHFFLRSFGCFAFLAKGPLDLMWMSEKELTKVTRGKHVILMRIIEAYNNASIRLDTFVENRKEKRLD